MFPVLTISGTIEVTGAWAIVSGVGGPGRSDRNELTSRCRSMNLNRLGFDAASFLEEDAHHVQALPRRAA